MQLSLQGGKFSRGAHFLRRFELIPAAGHRHDAGWYGHRDHLSYARFFPWQHDRGAIGICQGRGAEQHLPLVLRKFSNDAKRRPGASFCFSRVDRSDSGRTIV